MSENAPVPGTCELRQGCMPSMRCVLLLLLLLMVAVVPGPAVVEDNPFVDNAVGAVFTDYDGMPVTPVTPPAVIPPPRLSPPAVPPPRRPQPRIPPPPSPAVAKQTPVPADFADPPPVLRPTVVVPPVRVVQPVSTGTFVLSDDTGDLQPPVAVPDWTPGVVKHTGGFGVRCCSCQTTSHHDAGGS
jgi:hypothetical protein